MSEKSLLAIFSALFFAASLFETEFFE